MFVDGGLGHAIERIFGLICHYGGMRAVEHSDLLELPQAVMRARLAESGLFDPDSYLSMNSDLRSSGVRAWDHYIKSGLNEGRRFTSAETTARLLATMDEAVQDQRHIFRAQAERALCGDAASETTTLLHRPGVRIGVFWNSHGNFFIRELADLLVWGLQSAGIDAVLRDETASKDEHLDLRVIVAPHEFYILGAGKSWKTLADAPGTVFYNTEQLQTHWFCQAFPFLAKAPLILDINFQSAAVLRRACAKVIHFMPGYLPSVPYVNPYRDVSGIELLKGYSFGRQSYDWMERNSLDERPIDVLFIGSNSQRRDDALSRLQFLVDDYRFLCVYTRQESPLKETPFCSTSTAINCAIAQRSKIVLNLHRDWLGYFEWSRMVLQGFWQGACVVSEPCLPSPIFDPGVHYLEENARSVGELIDWLLSTKEGREKLDATRIAGHEQARTLGSMEVALAPVFNAFKQLLAR